MGTRAKVAIVGIGGIFPQAPGLRTFWDNICAGACASREVPEGRWIIDPAEVFDHAKGAPDKAYSLKACFVEDFRLDAGGFALPPSFIEKLDPAFHLALHAAREAFSSAGLKNPDLSRAGVIIGNIALPTESISALSRGLVGPAFEERVFGSRVSDYNSGVSPLNRYCAGLPAAVVARALGFGGGSYALDAACASSLYAVKLAADELISGRADLMLTGGVSRPDSLYTQMGFAQLRALSPSGRPAPFDMAADGLVVGEGSGMLVLRRLDDALRDGNRIYGVLCAAGLSNDIGGSLLAPSAAGQLRAMRAAYEQAGWKPQDVDHVECHATGTPTGDPVEVQSLKTLWGERGWSAGQCALGSVKSNIGHLLTAAGSAGLIKTLLGFKHKTLPPTANFSRPNPALRLDNSPFRISTEAKPWEERGSKIPRRAAVSAFGFGGINAHLLVEEYREGGYMPALPADKPKSGPAPVAIVGMDARFGKISGLRDFQEKMLSGEGMARGMSFASERDGSAVSSSAKGHFLPDMPVETGAFRIPPRELEECLPQQALILLSASRAIADAGIAPRLLERTGVFIGLGLDFNTANFNFRWSLSRAARKYAGQKGWTLSPEEEKALVSKVREAAGPALNANRVMGSLASIAASRIAREFQIGGPSFSLSSEDTSGMRALDTAVRLLQTGDIDCALAGAVDISGDARQLQTTDAVRPYSKAGQARPFDKRADGAVPGEGAAALVLKRLEDAVKDGDRIYAVIRGSGFAAGTSGQDVGADAQACSAAMRRAYEDAHVDCSTVSYLEASASGYPREDRAEAAAMCEVFGIGAAEYPCAVGAAAAEAGHAGAACGLVGVVKTSLALYQEILPPFKNLPLPGFLSPVEELSRASRRFHLPARPQYWFRNRAEGPRRAGVTSVGVEGNCGHLVLESFDGVQSSPQVEIERRQPLGARKEALFAVTAMKRADLPAALSELEALSAQARKLISEGRPSTDDRIAFTGDSVLPPDSLAFVFPGSGNHYPGMGVGLGANWPEIYRRQDLENGYLKSQCVPNKIVPWRFGWNEGWSAETEAELNTDFHSTIFSSVVNSVSASDLLRSFGLKPRFVIGYSLGETAGLFAMRAWTARDEMLRRMKASSLFVNDLAGPCDAARRFWNLPPQERVDWVLGVIDRPADNVKLALRGMERAALLIVNAPFECVVGGYRKAVDSLVDGLGCVFLPLQGVSTVHFPAAELVAKKYRELHLLPTSAPQGVRIYSGAWGKAYDVTSESAADSITAQAVKSLDFQAVVRQAYADGARLFVETGPQASCTRMIGKILSGQPHASKSMNMKGADEVSSVLRLLARLVAERVPLNLGELYGRESLVCAHLDKAAHGPRVMLPLSLQAPSMLDWKPVRREVQKPVSPTPVAAAAVSVPSAHVAPAVKKAHVHSVPSPRPVVPEVPSAMQGQVPPALPPAIPVPDTGLAGAVLASQAEAVRAHEAFLRLNREYMDAQARAIAFQNQLLSALGAGEVPSGGVLHHDVPVPAATAVAAQPAKPVFMNRRQCLEFAVGKIGPVLGAAFAHADAYPTRVRLPDEPLMLVDRIVEVRGTPNSMKGGAVVTEHDVLPGAWYLDHGRIPTCIAVEAGQADLFLSGYLGIDGHTKGLAVYRLLDAEVTFHDHLPVAGDTIHYDIRIERFARHNDTWLFFFNYESTVNGRPLLSMRKGCAGFFTQAELDAGKGIILTDDEIRPVPGKVTGGFEWLAPKPSSAEKYSDEQVAALRDGNLEKCFGPAFSGLPLKEATRLPSGKMKLVDRVLSLEPDGGRYGLGKITAEADIHPDDWHIVCHFIDDHVMPGTLMYECCMHTMRILLTRMGWAGEAKTCWYEPVPEVTSGLRCRGQVLASTKKVVYEISIKEIGYGPEPYALADAMMYADGKPIVFIPDMSIRMCGTGKTELEALWKKEAVSASPAKPLFDAASIRAFAVGKPSEAFGDRYRIFDSGRVIARLPGPPYQFLDRITSIRDCEQWVMKAGGSVTAEYDVPPREWYFGADGQGVMPFAVLLEVALQPCGWLAAYVGSALTSDTDLSFRNLGGTATLYEPVRPDAGVLVTEVKLTKAARSGGMVIQDYSMKVYCKGRRVYEGITQFGFFSKKALAEQVGVRGAAPYSPSAEETARGGPLVLLCVPPLPGKQLMMLDEISLYVPDGGPKKLGFVRGVKKVDPGEWFFKAHFYQDPVCPGSLGLESFIQLMKAAASARWKNLPPGAKYEALACGEKHTWVYRGQVIPSNKLVTVEAVITAQDDERRMLKADGFLKVDGLVIYQMKDFSLRIV